jgi:hypothetical protein
MRKKTETEREMRLRAIKLFKDAARKRLATGKRRSKPTASTRYNAADKYGK